MLVSSTQRITGVHYTCGCATSSGGYVGYLYLQNYWVSVHLWVSRLKCSFYCQVYLQNQLITLELRVPHLKFRLCLLALRTELTELHYTYGNATLSADYVGYHYFQITGLHHTNRCPTLRTAYVGQLYLENHWVTLHLLVSSLKCSL